MYLISRRDARQASEALMLASTGARILAGMDRCDPEAQLHRMNALANIEDAVKVLNRLGPPLDIEPYRDRILRMVPDETETWTGGDVA